MKKIITLSFITMAMIGSAFASDDFEYRAPKNYYQTSTNDCSASNMRRELDNATMRRRAVVTVVKCNDAQPAAAPVRVARSQKVVGNGCYGCNQPVEAVIDRKYFVQETREVYKPVVQYVSAGTYTTTRQVCGNDMYCR